MSKLIQNELDELLTEEPWSDELPDTFEVFVSGDWTDEGKFESKSDVVKHLPSGRFFMASFSRYGDHWQGYETSYEGSHEVTPKLVKRIVYVGVKS
ncbi:hypothetical protein [Salmonella phage DS_BP2]|uniref:Nucleotide reductase subunit C n=3 Tax=Berlinvirus TaxID=2732677 RepID=A0AAF0H806_9CAUD|nr:hypothetical protein vBSalMLPST153_orf00021 [Salmonella phage vB_SalM-LPST153]QEP53499.1 hypothetical protein LPST144_orf00024 [Salmonella phage LPST144]WGV38304.1 hypothetical protein SWJM03_00028 [Salmonella phage SWJM-03]